MKYNNFSRSALPEAIGGLYAAAAGADACVTGGNTQSEAALEDTLTFNVAGASSATITDIRV